MKKFKYTLDSGGNVVAFGYMDFDHELKGDEPFQLFEIVNYKYNLELNQWEELILIPKSISKLQAISILLEMNRYNDLISAIDADQTGIKRILFDAAAVLHRDSKMVNEIGVALGFTSECIDKLFVEADKILV